MMPVTPPVNPPAIELIHVGGPTNLLRINGFQIITDPTFDEPGKDYPSGSVTLKKLNAPAIPAHDLQHVNLVLLSHDQHADNLDRSGRQVLKSADQVLTTVSAASRLGGNARGLAPWESQVIELPDHLHLRVTATPARHGPSGIERIVGEVTGFVLSIEETKQDLLYITGDTVWFDGLMEVSNRFRPRYILLFAGAAETRGPFRLTMDVSDALETAAWFSEATLIPVHCEGWAHFTQSAEDIEKGFAALGVRDRLLVPHPGVKVSLP